MNFIALWLTYLGAAIAMPCLLNCIAKHKRAYGMGWDAYLHYLQSYVISPENWLRREQAAMSNSMDNPLDAVFWVNAQVLTMLSMLGEYEGVIYPGIDVTGSADMIRQDSLLYQEWILGRPIGEPLHAGYAYAARVGNPLKPLIRKLQQRWGLPETGRVDDRTRRRIAQEFRQMSIPQIGEIHPLVPRLVYRLAVTGIIPLQDVLDKKINCYRYTQQIAEYVKLFKLRYLHDNLPDSRVTTTFWMELYNPIYEIYWHKKLVEQEVSLETTAHTIARMMSTIAKEVVPEMADTTIETMRQLAKEAAAGMEKSSFGTLLKISVALSIWYIILNPLETASKVGRGIAYGVRGLTRKSTRKKRKGR